MISSTRATACGFSILAMTSARPLAIALTSATSSGRWTKESAIQSMFSSSAARRSARSLSVIAEVGIVVSGRLTPFLLETRPATSTIVEARPSSASATRNITLPSSIRMRWPGASELRISGCGSCTRAASPGRESLSRTKTSPLCNSEPSSANRPSLSFGPCRSTSTPIGLPASSSSARIIATRSRIASCEAWLMLMRKTSAPAANRAATVSWSAEAGPRVAMIFTRRLRRKCTGLLLELGRSGRDGF